jgi:hypothetical protein
MGERMGRVLWGRTATPLVRVGMGGCPPQKEYGIRRQRCHLRMEQIIA